MADIDWESWRQHVDYVVDKRGVWYGLGDGDGNPLFTLPEPIEKDTPDQWMESTDLEVTFSARGTDGEINRLTDLLVMSALRDFDPSGKLPTAQGDYMLLVAFPGDGDVVRRGGMITHVEASDTDNDGVPAEITVHALNVMDVWNTIPAASWPAAWWAATPYSNTSDESGISYKASRLMARIELATRTTFTWKHGPAGFVIRRLAQESLDATMMTQRDPDGKRWIDDPYHIVEVPHTDLSPTIDLEAKDGFLWETVAGQAENAGLILGAYLWWPGDKPVRSWSLANSRMSPAQVDISPSQGASQRREILQTFSHAMIVMTVKEVN